MLAWYFAGFHTSIDCFEKRKQKGLLFTIGDEPCLKEISALSLKKIMGEGQYNRYHSNELLDKAREKYDIYHLHLREGVNGSRKDVICGWKQLLRDQLIIIDNKAEIAKIVSDIVISKISHNTAKIPGVKKQDIFL